MSDKEREFVRRRWQFFGVVAVGVAGWALGTGLIPLPRWLGLTKEGEEGVEEEWEEVEEYVR